jgi:MFS family permease
MTMMRVRGVWTTNAAAFLIGAGMYTSFIIIPQFVQLPRSTGFGFGLSVVVSGLYLLPLASAMMLMSLLAGRTAARFGSRLALIAGAAITAAAFVFLVIAHSHPVYLLISSGLIGIGNGLAFSALGNLIVGAVPPHQTGVASGMNTVMRTLGGAIGAQVAATFISDNTAHGLPTLTGFTDSFVLGSVLLLAGIGAATLVPRVLSARETVTTVEPHGRPSLLPAAGRTDAT